MNLLNMWSSRPGPGWKKIPSHSLWFRINLLCICRCRQPSYHSWWKM
jgi:hypothetical protein